MLVFARHEEVGVSLVRVESLAQEVIDLLRPVIASSVRLSLEVRSTPPSVSIDPTQLHQVLVNLMTNANHALGGRAGEIALAIRPVAIADERVAGLDAGDYVELSIRDDGLPVSYLLDGPITSKGPQVEGSGTSSMETRSD